MSARSKTPLILIEMTIMLLVFSIFAAVCLKVFAGARSRSAEAGELSRAFEWAQSAADCYRASGGDLDETARLLSAQVTGSGRLILELDSGWNAAEDGCAYTLTLSETAKNGAYIKICRAGNVMSLFSLYTEAVAYG